MINYIKRLIFNYRIKSFDKEKLINDLKMRTKECEQKQDLINELLLKLKPDPNYTGYTSYTTRPKLDGRGRPIINPDTGQPVLEMTEDGCIINPIWQVKVSHYGEKIVAMPFLYYIHSHLKTYGFDPDNKMRDKGLEVSIAMKLGEEGIILPFYIKGDNVPEGERLENLDPNIGVIRNKKTGQDTIQKDLLK